MYWLPLLLSWGKLLLLRFLRSKWARELASYEATKLEKKMSEAEILALAQVLAGLIPVATSAYQTIQKQIGSTSLPPLATLLGQADSTWAQVEQTAQAELHPAAVPTAALEPTAPVAAPAVTEPAPAAIEAPAAQEVPALKPGPGLSNVVPA